MSLPSTLRNIPIPSLSFIFLLCSHMVPITPSLLFMPNLTNCAFSCPCLLLYAWKRLTQMAQTYIILFIFLCRLFMRIVVVIYQNRLSNFWEQLSWV
jgi:hypothetical protein